MRGSRSKSASRSRTSTSAAPSRARSSSRRCGRSGTAAARSSACRPTDSRRWLLICVPAADARCSAPTAAQLGRALRVEWDASVMPYVWFWQEFGRPTGYPWYGRHYNVGLEPFTSYPTNGLAEAVANGSALELPPRGQQDFWLTATVVDG